LIALLLGTGALHGAQAQNTRAQARRELRAGAELLRQGRIPEAEKRAINSLTLDPANPEIYALLGVICDQSGRGEEAVQHFQKAVELEPNSASARNNLGSSYFRQGKADFARGQFERSLAIEPGNFTANYNMGLLSLAAGDAGRAAVFLEKARQVAPKDQGTLLNLARAYFALGRNEEGLGAVHRVAQSHPADANARFLAGTLLLEQQLFREAAEQLDAAAKLAPQNTDILLALATAQKHAGDGDAALISIRRFLDSLAWNPQDKAKTAAYLQVASRLLRDIPPQGPSAARAVIMQSQVLYVQGQYGEAVKLLQSGVAPGAQTADYHNVMGMSLAGLNQLPAAAQSVIRAIEMEPERGEFYFNLASLYQRANDNPSAISTLEKGLARDPRSVLMHFALGLSNFNLGKYQAALTSFQTALKIQPDFERAQFFVGRTLARSGRPLDAVAAYQKTVALRPEYAPAHLQLALVLQQLGRTPEARSSFQDVIRLDPQSAEAHYHYGKILAAEGRTAEGVAELEEAVRLQPGYDDANFQLARLYLKQGKKEQADVLFKLVNERKKQRREKYESTIAGSTAEKPN
jgi:tetratricopeptide (TPR) repeat protein